MAIRELIFGSLLIFSAIGCEVTDDLGDKKNNSEHQTQDSVENMEQAAQASFSFEACGTGCPSGYHPTATTNYNYSCGGYGNHSTTCQTNSGSYFETCGTGCPSGYHPTATTSYNYSCGGYGNHSTTCQTNGGSYFETCGTGCPSGYYPIATTSYNYSCGGYGNHSTTCQAI